MDNLNNLGCTLAMQEYFFPSEDAPAKRQEAWVKSVALAAHRNRKAAAQALSTSGSGKLAETEAGGSGTLSPTKMPRAGSGKQALSVPASPAPPGGNAYQNMMLLLCPCYGFQCSEHQCYFSIVLSPRATSD